MRWHAGSPQITSRSWSSRHVTATTPSLSRSCIVLRSRDRARGSPDLSTTIRPALLSVHGGTLHVGFEDVCETLIMALEALEVRLAFDLDFLGFDVLLFLSLCSLECEDPVGGAGLDSNSKRLLTYALSALTTGSPSLTMLKNKLFRNSGLLGFSNGSRLMGGAPNVTQ